MNNYEILGLYDHNIRSYEKVKQQFKKDNIAAIVHATGTGKSFNALQLALDNKDKKIIYVVPYGSVIEHEKELIEQNENISLEKDFPNLEFRTYQSFINMSDDEIADLDVDLLILDEFHHIGAPVWGQRINTLVEAHEDLQIFGMTAYTVRDRGTAYERDMVNPENDELFSNKVVSNYDLCDAMIEEVLPKPNYKSGYIYLEETCEYLEDKINSLNSNSADYKELEPLLRDLKKRVHEAPGVSDIFKTNIKPNGKYIYFCPLNPENGVNDMDSIMSEARNWIHEMGLTEDDYEFYMTTSDMGIDGKRNREAFYNDKDLNQNDTSNKLRIMFAINQYNEGVHVPGLDGVIMARSTKSDIIFFEQLGRALSAGHDTEKEYEEYNLKSRKELIEECKRRELTYNESMSKEELIEILLAPIIIDLSNNIGFIKELETNLKDRIKEYTSSENNGKINVHLKNASFDIDMINEDLFKILEYVRDRLTITWMDKYELAKAYYEHYKNLKVPADFKTVNGYDYDENGIALGNWIYTQRQSFNGQGTGKISEEQIELLKQIGMRFEIINKEEEWEKRYELAKAYYKHYGNLEVPSEFKTINGYKYDKNGIDLGGWIRSQRKDFKGSDGRKISEERIELLKQIGMRFETKNKKEEWNKKYELAKAYFKYHGNLKVPAEFKTINGYDYDANGVLLGSWIKRQRSAYNGKGKNKITKEQIELLSQIGMRFEIKDKEEEWNKNYELAKAYYEHYHNLEVPPSFKTKNGYDSDEKGVLLGSWISHQRNSFKENRMSEKRIELLKQIGMRFEIKDKEEEWNKNYELAKAYYEHYHNLEVPYDFKTKNGYDSDEKGIALGSWISQQRRVFKKNKISEERIKLLKQIGMRFETRDKKEEWNKKYELAKAYYEHYHNLEVPYDFKTKNGYDSDEKGIALGSWIYRQRKAYQGQDKCKITEEQIELLNQIGIKWFSEDIDINLQKEKINGKNINRKKIELYNRFIDYVSKYKNDELPSKDELNSNFIEELDRPLKK